MGTSMEIRVNKARLKERRDELLLTQEQLAERCGVHVRTIQRIEASGIVSAQTLQRISRALEADASDLRMEVGVNAELDNWFQMVTRTIWGVGAAFMWVALSVLVWVPTSDGGLLTTLIAGGGFACFVSAIWFFKEGVRRQAVFRS